MLAAVLAALCTVFRVLCVVCREQFSPVLRYALWIMAEIAIIGSDIQEVIGSAIALLLLSQGAIPLWGGVLLSVAVSFSMLLVERFGIRKLEALFGVLISIMVASFAVSYNCHLRLWCVAAWAQYCQHASAAHLQQQAVWAPSADRVVQQQPWLCSSSLAWQVYLACSCTAACAPCVGTGGVYMLRVV